MGNRTLACIGDSMIRNMCMGVGFFLSDHTPETEGDLSFDEKAKLEGYGWTRSTKIENGYILPNKEDAAKNNWQWQLINQVL